MVDPLIASHKGGEEEKIPSLPLAEERVVERSNDRVSKLSAMPTIHNTPRNII
jgi:hypothetical protein